MKNISLILIIYFLGFGIVFGQEVYEPINLDSLHYDSCVVYRIEDSNKTIASKHTYTYEGLPIEKFVYDDEGDLHLYQHFDYDPHGNLIEKYSQDFPKVFEFADTTSRFAQEMIREARWHNRKTRYTYEYNYQSELVKQTVYSVSYDKNKITENDRTFTEEKHYDGCGRLTLKVGSWPSSQNRSDTNWYAYDTLGRLISEKKKGFNKNPYTTKYSYNSDGLREKKVNSNHQNQPLNTWISEYDSEGNLIAYTRFDAKNNVVMEEKIFYPAKFDSYYIYKTDTYQKEEWTSHDSLKKIVKNHIKKLNGSGYSKSPYNGKSSYKSKFKYDSLNRVVEDKQYWKQFPINDYEGKTQFQYNDQNQKIKEIEYDEKDIVTDVTLFYYNTENQVINTADYLSNDTLYGYTYFTYDSIGLVATREIVDSNGIVELFQTYEYNGEGIETGGVFYKNGYYELFETYNYHPDGSFKSIYIIAKQGNKVIEEYTLIFSYFGE